MSESRTDKTLVATRFRSHMKESEVGIKYPSNYFKHIRVFQVKVYAILKATAILEVFSQPLDFPNLTLSF